MKLNLVNLSQSLSSVINVQCWTPLCSRRSIFNFPPPNVDRWIFLVNNIKNVITCPFWYSPIGLKVGGDPSVCVSGHVSSVFNNLIAMFQHWTTSATGCFLKFTCSLLHTDLDGREISPPCLGVSTLKPWRTSRWKMKMEKTYPWLLFLVVVLVAMNVWWWFYSNIITIWTLDSAVFFRAACVL